MSLNDEINNARLKVHTDAYPMSIGELVNLYQDEEIEIHPEFQRIFRWSDSQKSKLIESILLGIPLPSIFVSQRDDGVWDVVDGLQRLSTIFSFLGVLKDEDGELLKPLELQSTKYLPSLEGKVWEDKHNPERQIDVEIRRVFKREKLDIKIIKRESEGSTKFELFQRLNTGGTRLSDQEVRNCMLLMLTKDGYEWLQNLSKTECFRSTLPLSGKQKEECYDQELMLRFLVQRHFDEVLRKSHSDVGPYLDAEMNRLFSEEEPVLNFSEEKEIFEKTFSIFAEALGEESFKKFNHDKGRREGAVSVPVFEALTLGVSEYIKAEGDSDRPGLIKKVREASEKFTAHQGYIDAIDKSMRPLDRMLLMGNVGRELIA